MSIKPNEAGEKLGLDRAVIVISVAAAVFFWILDAVVDTYVFRVGAFIDALFWPGASELWMRLVITGILTLFGFYASSRIFALRHAGEMLLGERNKAQKYFDTAEVILLVLGPDGKVVDINRSGCAALGCEKAKIIGVDWIEGFIPEDKKDDALSVFRGLVSGKVNGFEHFEIPVLTRGQGERIIMWHNAILTDARGAIYATLSAGMDVTERKRMESELERSLNELEMMNRLMVGRELKIVELKKEMVNLKARLKEREPASMHR